MIYVSEDEFKLLATNELEPTVNEAEFTIAIDDDGMNFIVYRQQNGTVVKDYQVVDGYYKFYNKVVMIEHMKRGITCGYRKRPDCNPADYTGDYGYNGKEVTESQIKFLQSRAAQLEMALMMNSDYEPKTKGCNCGKKEVERQ